MKKKIQSEYKEFLDRNFNGELPNELPLAHTTRTEFFELIKASGQIEPQLCPVFGEYLIYFFYGRPAYRPKQFDVHEIGYCPICLLLDLDPYDLHLRRSYPLDSGGVEAERFGEHLAPAELDSLELPPNVGCARKHVSVAYNSNRKYFLGNFVDPDDLDFLENDIAKRYFDLLGDSNVASSDDRRSAVEYQSLTAVSIERDVKAVILPEAMLDDDDVFDTIVIDWKAVPIGYPTFRATCPSDYVPVIRDRVLAFLENEELIERRNSAR